MRTSKPRPDHGFARLFSNSRHALTRYVRRLVKSSATAEDIVQEAYLRTFTHRGAQDCEPLRPYLFSIARNLASKVRRHERIVASHSARDLDPDLLQGADRSPEETLLSEERLRLLKETIESLPPQCRAAFTLRMFQDCSYKEIAAKLGISPKTVEKHIASASTAVHAALAHRYMDVK